jgi:hypothetical protein
MYVALTFLIGGIGAAGCAIWVPADPQTSQESQTTTTTSQPAPVSVTKTTVVRSSAY